MPGSYTWAGIYNTHFWVDPKRQIAAVILMQVLPFYDDGSMKLYQDFENYIYNEHVPWVWLWHQQDAYGVSNKINFSDFGSPWRSSLRDEKATGA